MKYASCQHLRLLAIGSVCSCHSYSMRCVMNCFECSASGLSVQAVGTCTSCGAGVCADHLHLDAHELAHTSSPGTYIPKFTRALTCNDCEKVLSNRQGSWPMAAMPM
ncbi:DUF2180 family protein [Nakamurella panacisegetis]|uniref:DUF2180 family protein n=1 Tax=Nakamurella panacisegetis TaxID=1090615 RepID=UPI000B86E340